MSKLRWKLRWYWRYLRGNPDGMPRFRKLSGALAVEAPRAPTAIHIYYAGAPGDPGSDTPVAYEVTHA